MIKTLFITEEEYGDYFELGKNNYEDNAIRNISKINILIGENNSGKSRFLRNIFINQKLQFDHQYFDTKEISDEIDLAIFMINENMNLSTLRDVREIIDKLERYSQHMLKFRQKNNEYINEIKNYLSHLFDTKYIDNYPHYRIRPEDAAQQIRLIIGKLMEKINPLFDKILEFNPEKLYIPILRGLRPLQNGYVNDSEEYHFKDSHDLYKSRTIADYFKSAHPNPEHIFTGLSLYKNIKEYLLNKREKRDFIKNFENFLSSTFFANEPVSLIPHIENDVLYIGIGEESERPIYDLGDGIQSIIVMLFPLFLNQDKSMLVFIEEPETSLHPGMQRIFIETLLRPEFRNFQYFITTHSNHFLDITLDYKSISIYTFHKKSETANKKSIFEIQNTNNGDIKILDLIGARTSSVFLSNCTIWLEGITDRLYLRKYLEVYQKHLMDLGNITQLYKEDIHFSFVEYGGGNIVHFSFSDKEAWDKIKTSRISNKIFLIADQDDTKDNTKLKKTERLDAFKENLGENFRVIDGREIENTLSPNTLIKTIEALQRGDKELEYAQAKIKIEKYKNVKLGKFIKEHFKNTSRNYAGKYETLVDKVGFCQVAVTKINSIDDLSDEGKKLAEDIYNFIKRSNE